MVLEAKKSKVKTPADSVSGESQLLSSQTAIFLLCPHMAEGVGALSGVSSIRALIPFMRPLSHDLITRNGLTSKHHHIGD